MLSEGQAAGPLCNPAALWTVTGGQICKAKVEKLLGPQYPWNRCDQKGMIVFTPNEILLS